MPNSVVLKLMKMCKLHFSWSKNNVGNRWEKHPNTQFEQKTWYTRDIVNFFVLLKKHLLEAENEK